MTTKIKNSIKPSCRTYNVKTSIFKYLINPLKTLKLTNIKSHIEVKNSANPNSGCLTKTSPLDYLLEVHSAL